MVKFHNNKSPSVLFEQQASDPDAPDTSQWRLFFKAGGLYAIDDAGAVTQIGEASTVLTTKGDLLGFGTDLARLGVGADGHVLTADSAEALGVKWAAGGGGGGGMVATVTVAASDATAGQKAAADYECDGTADEVQINSAIADAHAAGGGLVLLSGGTFNIAATIDLTATEVTLAGMGWATTITVPNSTNPSYHFITGVPVRCSVERLQLDGNKANNTGTYRGIQSTSASTDLRLVDLWIHDMNNLGVWASGAGKWRFVRCRIAANGNKGVHLDTSGLNVRFIDCQIDNNTGAGVDVRATDVWIVGCNIHNNTGFGVDATSAGARLAVIGCRLVSNGSTGIQNLAVDGIVSGCDVRSNTTYGIYMQGGARFVIANNSVRSNGNHGIRTFAGSDGLISGNVVNENATGTTGDGISIEGSGTRHLITGNTVRGATNQRYGVRIAAGTGHRVVGNDLYNGGATDSLNDAGTSTVLSYPAHGTYGDNFTS